jgi:hypothetical protein
MAEVLWVEVQGLQDRFDRAEEQRQEAAEAERLAFAHWQDCFGAYEHAKDRASAAWAALAEGIGGL